MPPGWTRRLPWEWALPATLLIMLVFFRGDWSGGVNEGGAATRTSRQGAAWVWVAVVPGRALRVHAMLAPEAGAGTTTLDVYLNGRRVGTSTLPGGQHAACVFDVDPELVTTGHGVIEFRASRPFEISALSITAREAQPGTPPDEGAG